MNTTTVDSHREDIDQHSVYIYLNLILQAHATIALLELNTYTYFFNKSLANIHRVTQSNKEG